MDVTLTPDAPLPSEPYQFRGVFIWTEIEQDTGQPPAQTLHNDVMGRIPLQVDDGDLIVLTGSLSPMCHDSNKVHVNGHGHAMAFQVICTNYNPMITKKVLWKRTFSPKELEEVMPSQQITTSGFAPDVANGRTTGTGYINLGQGVHRGKKTVESVKITMSHTAYNAWINQYMF